MHTHAQQKALTKPLKQSSIPLDSMHKIHEKTDYKI